MKIIIIYTTAILSFLFTFCKKKDVPEPPDTTPPVITINSPVTGTSYNTSDTVFITGTVLDSKALKSVSVKVRYTDREVYLLEYTPVIVNNSCTFSTYHVVTDVESEHYYIMVDADDEAGNHADMDIKVNANHHH